MESNLKIRLCSLLFRCWNFKVVFLKGSTLRPPLFLMDLAVNSFTVLNFCHPLKHLWLNPMKILTFPKFNPFLANAPILYSLKTPENQKFSGVFRGYKMGTLTRDGLNLTSSRKPFYHNITHYVNKWIL